MKWTIWDEYRDFDASAVPRWEKVLLALWVVGMALAAYFLGR